MARADVLTCGRTSHQWVRTLFGREVVGPGPVFPVTTWVGKGVTVEFFRPGEGVVSPKGVGPWFAQKVGWLFPPQSDYAGGALIRVFPVGHDGKAVLTGDLPAITDTVYLTPRKPESRDSVDGAGLKPSMTFVSQRGCYAWQVDGDGFSYNILFTAKVVEREVR